MCCKYFLLRKNLLQNKPFLKIYCKIIYCYTINYKTMQ